MLIEYKCCCIHSISIWARMDFSISSNVCCRGQNKLFINQLPVNLHYKKNILDRDDIIWHDVSSRTNYQCSRINFFKFNQNYPFGIRNLTPMFLWSKYSIKTKWLLLSMQYWITKLLFGGASLLSGVRKYLFAIFRIWSLYVRICNEWIRTVFDLEWWCDFNINI